MYKDYFGLRDFPFSIAPDPRYLYMSSRHRDALAHLLYGINSDNGFILLTGEVGTGKTTVCRCLLEQVPSDCEIAFILNPKVTALELLASICDEFQIPYPTGNGSIKIFVDAINSHLLEAHASGKKTVLIIEEAQNLSPDVLEQIRLLTNLETNDRKLLQIIMIGQPELRDILGREDLRQLSQRVTARYHLGPLSEEEIPAYISHRLSVAGVRAKLFHAAAIHDIYKISKGIPRIINLLCDRALLGTYAQGLEEVDKKTIQKAAEEVLGKGAQGNRKAGVRVLSGIAAAAVIAGIILVLMSSTARRTGDYKTSAEPELSAPSGVYASSGQNRKEAPAAKESKKPSVKHQAAVGRQTSGENLFFAPDPNDIRKKIAELAWTEGSPDTSDTTFRKNSSSSEGR